MCTHDRREAVRAEAERRSLTTGEVTSVLALLSQGVSLRQVRRVARPALRRLGVIWSSDEAHTVDALAVRGEEGRGSLRKASASWQQA